MIVDRSAQTSQNSKLGSGLGFSTQGNQITVDDLLAVARAQGGAVAQVAEELTNPRTSMLSTIGDNFKKAFGTFVDVISAPNQIVAGMISSKYSIEDAVKKNISVSDVVMGKQRNDKKDLMSRAGSFITRTAIDVLTDPLTYVTFGASRGLLGLSAGLKVTAKANTAERLGLKNIGDDFAISEEAEDIIHRAIKGDETMSETDILFRAEAVDAQKKGLTTEWIKKKRPQVMDELAEAGEEITDANVSKRLMGMEDELATFLDTAVLGAKLRPEFAVQAMSNLIEKHPALIETLVDKGGIKFFGQSLLSGQRIRDTVRLIPGISLVDNITEPIRNGMGALFNRNYTINGRLPDEFVHIDQKFRDLADSMNNEVLTRATALFRELGVTREEAELITSAIETSLEPSDPRLREIWRSLNGFEPVGNSIVRPEILRAAGFTKEQLNKNMQMLREAGVPVANFANYFPHILVKQDTRKLKFRLPPSQNPNANKFAKFGAMTDDEGNRLVVAFDGKMDEVGRIKIKTKGEDGQDVTRTIRYVDQEKELKKIHKIADDRKKELTDTFNDLVQEVNTSKELVKGKFGKKMVELMLKKVDGTGAMVTDLKDFANVFSDFVDNRTIDGLLTARLASMYKAGIKTKTGSISAPDFKKIVEDIIDKNKSTEDIVADLNSKFKAKITGDRTDGVKTMAKPKSGSVDPELLKIARTLQDAARDGRKQLIKDKLDKGGMTELMEDVFNAFLKNPSAISKALDKIIKKSQDIKDVSAEFGDVARSLKLDEDEIIQNAGRFIDEASGTALTRVRATIKELKETFKMDFEDNALTGMLLGSMEAVKTSVTRDFIREVGQKMGVKASQAPNGFRAVGVTGLKHEGQDVAANLTDELGEQLYFHPDVAKRLEEFTGSLSADEATEKLMQNYDKLQNFFKATVTSIWPAFHGRNAISNTMLHFLDIGMHSLDPANHVAAANMINLERQFMNLQLAVDSGKSTADEMTEFMSKEIMTDRNGYAWSFGELRSVIKKNVIAFNPRNIGQIDQVLFSRDSVDDLTRALFPNGKEDKLKNAWASYSPLSTKNVAIKTGFKVGQLVEDQARLVDFMVNLKKTGDVQLAAQRTKQFLFDYQNLSEFERKFMRRIIPFYTFSRKNIELQVRTLFTNPGRIAGEIRAVQTIGDVLGAGDLSEEDKQKLPDWMQNGINALLEKDGSHITVLSSLQSPIEQIFQQVQPNQALSSGSPILRLPMEMMSGYSFFHGKMISEVTNAAAFKSAPEAIKDFIGFTEVTGQTKDGKEYTSLVSLRPSRMHLLLSLPPTARVMSSLKQMQNEDISAQFRIMQFLIGARPYEFDLEIEAQRRETELRKELENILDLNKTGFKMERYILPKEDSASFQGF